MIFASSHKHILKSAKKYQICHTMGVSNLSGAYMIFASSHTTYLEAGKKIPNLPQNWGI